MLALFLASATFLHGVRPVTQPRIPPVMAIGSDRAAAEAQLAEYFAMAPWEKNIELIPNQRLDLRMFVQPFDRGGAIIAAVFVNQKGLPIIDGGGGAGFGVKRGRLWRCVGTITARTEEDLSTAVANQRELIIAWAEQLVYEFKSGRKLLQTGPGSPPIEVAWSLKPNGFKKMINPSYQGELQIVPPETPKDDSVQCGFMGTNNRSVKGKKGGFRFVKVELPA